MNDGVVVMVDGRAKVLQRTCHRDDELLRSMLDTRPDLVLRPATACDRLNLLLVARRAAAASPTHAGVPALERVYVDGDGIPLLVGVQAAHGGADADALLGLLDRVSLALPHWRDGWLRELARATHGDRDEAALLALALGWREDPDTYWAMVESNASRERVRIVLVVDRLTDELTRTVEFLDGQLRDVEVRAVEVSLYGAGQVCALIPRSTRPGSPSPRARAAPAALFGLLDPTRRSPLPAPGRHRRRG
jgi:hypothetical protein